ncbi:holin [Streptomyces sp. NPDC000927]|uniref:holin n=1 Tax=Streptomyces sp. NPDC000927 TaxID=3154371 RepID=UPI00332DDFAA
MGFRTALLDARFWGASFERAILTIIQTMAAQVAVFTATDVEKLGLTGLSWGVMTSVAMFAGISSLLTSLGKAGATKGRGPGLVEELLPRRSVDPVIASPAPADADPTADIGRPVGK